MFVNLIVTFLISTSISQQLSMPKDGKYSFDIIQTWDNQTTPDYAKVTVTLSTAILSPSTENQLEITVDAPFYNDPPMSDDAPKETFDGLWDYEVVEVFLLGNDDYYLEIELGPKGQYLLLELKGYRNPIRTKLPLYNNHFNATITNQDNPYPVGNSTWHGRAIIPNCYLPENITKFNAFAIHANVSEPNNDNRTYMSLFPVPTGKYPGANFHRLEYFGDWTDPDFFPNNKNSAFVLKYNLFLLFIVFCFICDFAFLPLNGMSVIVQLIC